MKGVDISIDISSRDALGEGDQRRGAARRGDERPESGVRQWNPGVR